MEYTSEQATLILNNLAQEMSLDIDPVLKLKRIWWTQVGMRVRFITNTLAIMNKATVQHGPFKGLKLTQEAINGYNSCLILGTYEHELHLVFEKIIAGHYTRILNIGCSVGYYAVGLAMRMPHLIIDAFDIDPEARRKCADMAALNGVQDRVRISAEFRGEDFATYADEKTMALVDIEAAELFLLDPTNYPALKKIDVVVEMHDLMNPEISPILIERFAPTHNTTVIKNQNILPDLSLLPPNFPSIDPFDHLMLGWEGRDGATPWGVFMAKS